MTSPRSYSLRRLIYGGAIAAAVVLVMNPVDRSPDPDSADSRPWKSWAPGGARVESGPGQAPDDWFQRQRAFPFAEIPASRVEELALAREWANDAENSNRGGSNGWALAGPSNVHGRITAMAADPTAPDRVFIGAADGGVFRSTNGGADWAPVFDDMPVLSIGAIAIDPTDPDVIYVGTGETNAAGDTYAGDGVYKSTDGGDSWINVGLPLSAKIGRISIDPKDSQRVFVAVTGPLYSTSAERGVYRSENGGNSWEQVLFVAEDAGAIDVVVDPSTSRDFVFAATWDRLRTPTDRRVGGLGSGVWRSSDGGDTWVRLDGVDGLPASASNLGRIGLTQCASSPDVLYAYYCDNPGSFIGVYKTTDAGESWSQVNDGAISGVTSSFGWYFGQIRVDPKDSDRVFVLGVPVYRSTNGGNSWSSVDGSMHVDHHALWIDPTPGSNLIYCGNDGGFYRSTNNGSSWTKRGQLPITQFYAITVDSQSPWRLYGGTQDNSTNRTLTGGIDDWDVIYFGDGFYSLVDPRSSEVIYAEYQYGGLAKSTNTGASWDGATSGIPSGDRRNWSTPVVFDPSDPDILYYGTYRVFRSTNGASSWNAISGDLTDGDPPGGLVFGTITTIDVASTNPNAVIAGADDGNVSVTYNGGGTWNSVSATFPERWVTRVAFDPLDDQVLYVTLSGYRYDEYVPHLLRSSNGGASWDDIAGDLPGIPLNDIVVDPEDTTRLYVASDAGVFFSSDLGASWSVLGAGLPPTSVFDLHLHNPTRELVAGTHGRSMWKFDLDEVTGVEEPVANANLSTLRVTASPNPFAGTTRLQSTLPSGAVAAEVLGRSSSGEGLVVGTIHDVEGRLVRRLSAPLADDLDSFDLTWDGNDSMGHPVSPGTYFYRLSAGPFEGTGTVVRIR